MQTLSSTAKTDLHAAPNGGRPLTGKRVLLYFVIAFGVILAANLTMMFSAINTFPGLEVKNSYVAARGFDERAAAQRALGWNVETGYADGQITVRVHLDNGQAAAMVNPEFTIGRTTTDRDNAVLDPIFTGAAFVADHPLAAGRWRLDVKATATDGTLFQKRTYVDVDG